MGRRNKQQFFEQVRLLAGGGEGHSIAKIDGKVIFVKYGAPGDVVDIKIVGRKKRYSLATITNLHQASEFRIDPFCEHYTVCGGCKWQHMSYDAQLQLKQQWARDCFERIGKIEVQEHLPILGSEEQRFYRNKMEYTFSNKRWLYENEVLDGLEHTNALGFHATGRFDKVIDINKCWLQDDKGNAIRNFVRQYSLEHNIPFYDIREHTGVVRNLMIRNTTKGEWMICVFAAGKLDEQLKGLLDAIESEFQPTSLHYSINNKKNDSIFDLDIIRYKGQEYITERLCGLDFKIHPKSFFQTNTKQAEKLYDVALEFAELDGTEVVYDLYCGTGSITLAAAKKAKKAIGVEIVEDAILAARENAEANALSNVEFLTGDMKDVFNAEFYAKHGAPDLIITDPPRAGMHPKVVEQLLEIECKKVVYVSCNPATQARDLEVLSAKYQCVKSRAVDMFPHTHHVENVVLLQRK